MRAFGYGFSSVSLKAVHTFRYLAILPRRVCLSIKPTGPLSRVGKRDTIILPRVDLALVMHDRGLWSNLMALSVLWSRTNARSTRTNPDRTRSFDLLRSLRYLLACLRIAIASENFIFSSTP